MITVSVIIPTHNRAELLSTAIRSVLNQTFQDFEVLVIDDGSTDDTPRLRGEFSDRRIRWLNHERPRGGAAARNTGILQSRGAYLAFLDDDDEWCSEKLERQVGVLQASPDEVALVYTGYTILDRATRKVGGRKVPSHRGDLSAVLMAGNCIGGTSSVMIRKKCLQKIGMFDEALPSFQDYDLWIRLSRAYRFEHVRELLMNYYLHSDKIWTHPESIQAGLAMMLEKYGGSARFRRVCSVYYLMLAVQLCEAAQNDRARQLLRRAIGLDPCRPKLYAYWLLSLARPSAYRRLQKAKSRVGDLLRAAV